MTHLEEIAGRIAGSGIIADTDVMELRRAVFEDGLVSRCEGEALFRIERSRTTHNTEWSAFFVEALTDYALKQEPPVGYLTSSTSEWIAEEIGKRKAPSTDAEVALVINIIEKARDVPASFSAFSLRLVKDVVIYGGGPDELGRMHEGGRISEADIIALQRILWGAGSEGLMAVSREEAEALFAIADASAGADNDSRFDDLFAKAIGNYLLGATGRSVPPRDVSLRWETERAHRVDVFGVLAGVFGNSAKAFDVEFTRDSLLNARTLSEDLEHALGADNEARAAAEAAASVLTPDKAGWLLDRVDRNGLVTAPEKALLRFIAREASAIDPALNPALEKAL